jgi:hypothetical protein
MNDTNLSNAGARGGTQNWQTGAGTTTPQQQPQIDPKTGKPIDPQAAAKGQATLLPGEELESDVLVTTPELNAHLHVDTQVSTSTNSNYVATSNRPSIPLPTVTDPNLGQQGLNAMVPLTPAKLGGVMDSMNQTISMVGDTPTLPEDTNVVVTDPSILQLAQDTGVAPAVIQHNVQTEKNTVFQELVSKQPPDVANKLTFAQYVPEGATNLDPQLKTLLQSLNTEMNQKVEQNFGFPSNWPGIPTDETDFHTQLGAEVDQSFSQLLDAKANEVGLTPAETATLRAMFNGAATGTPALKNILQQIQSNLTTQLQAKYGVDVSYQPKGDVAFYNSVVNGDFAQTYQKNVAKYTGQATAEQQVLLAKYAANPFD